MSTVSVDRSQRRNYGTEDRRYFGVTSICHAMTGGEVYGDQVAMDRGTDLHTIFALSVASSVGRCAPPVVPTEYEGYHRSMMHWIDAAKPEPVHIEKPSVSPVKSLPFAGTPDLLAWIHYQGRRVLVLVDLKSGQKARWHHVQVMAYSKLELYREAKMLRLLYIHADGSDPNFLPVKTTPHDWAAFQAALHLMTWREAA